MKTPRQKSPPYPFLHGSPRLNKRLKARIPQWTLLYLLFSKVQNPESQGDYDISKENRPSISGTLVATFLLIIDVNRESSKQKDRGEYNGRQPKAVAKKEAHQTTGSQGEIGECHFFLEGIAGRPADVSGYLVGFEIMPEKSPYSAQAKLDYQQPEQQSLDHRPVKEKDIRPSYDQGRY